MHIIHPKMDASACRFTHMNRQTVKLTPTSSPKLVGRYTSSPVENNQTARISLQVCITMSNSRETNKPQPRPLYSAPSKPLLPDCRPVSEAETLSNKRFRDRQELFSTFSSAPRLGPVRSGVAVSVRRFLRMWSVGRKRVCQKKFIKFITICFL